MEKKNRTAVGRGKLLIDSLAKLSADCTDMLIKVSTSGREPFIRIEVFDGDIASNNNVTTVATQAITKGISNWLFALRIRIHIDMPIPSSVR